MLWVVGKNYSELDAYLAEHQIPFGIFADQSIKVAQRHAARLVPVDFTSERALLNSLPTDVDVSAVIVAGYEQYVIALSWLAEHFGVPGPGRESAVRATDKYAMRQALTHDSYEFSPHFRLIQSGDDLADFAESYGLPAMLKPTNLMKSLYVSKSDTQAQLQQNYRQLCDILPRLKTLGSQTRILAEEFMEGTMHTVAGFVDQDGAVAVSPVIVDCRLAREFGFDDSFIAERCIPSTLSDESQKQILDTARRGAECLDLRSTPLHIEVMLTPEGPKIIEIGARLGGYRPRMYSYGCGTDLYAGLIATAFGKSVQLACPTQRYCSVIEIFSSTNGILEEIRGLDVVRQLDSLLHLQQKSVLQKEVGTANTGHRAPITVVLGSDEAAALSRDAQTVHEKVQLIVRPKV